MFGLKRTADLEFQNGRTDTRGVFAFVPDIPGFWRVEASDEQGHKGIIKVVVDQGNVELKPVSQVEA